MALTIVKEPEAICLAKNDQFVKFTTDEHITVAATNAYVSLSNTTGNLKADGDTFTLCFDDKTIVFTFKITPDNSGFQLPYGNFNDNAMRTYFEKNYDVLRYFNITQYTEGLGGDQKFIKLTKKINGLDLRVNTSSTNIVDINVLELYATNGANTAYAPNFKVPITVFEVTSVFDAKPIYTQNTEAVQIEDTSTSEVVLNLKEILKASLGYDMAYTYDVLTFAVNVAKRFFVLATERYGVSPINHVALKLNTFLAVNGAIMTKYFPFYKNYLSALITNDFFYLDYEKGEQTIDRNMPIVLHWLIEDNSVRKSVLASGTFTVMVTITWNDATTSSHVLHAATSATYMQEVAIIPCGFNNTKIQSIETGTAKKIVSYKVWMDYDGVSPYTFNPCERNFVVDDTYYYTKKYFRYANSLGGATCIRCTGEHSFGVKIDFSTFVKELNPDYTANTSAEEFTYNEEFTEELECNTGNTLTKAELAKYIDFLMSPQKFEIVAALREAYEESENNYPLQSGNYNEVPIIISPASVDLFKSEDGIFSLSFKYKYAHKNFGFNNNQLFV